MSTQKIKRSPDGPGDLCGPTEAAQILGVERTRVPRWFKEGLMPPPVSRLKIGVVWLRVDIEAKRVELDKAKAEKEAAKKAKAAA